MSRSSVFWILLAVLTVSDGALHAQRNRTTKAEQLEDELERSQRRFAETESRLMRLQELRLRLAFGLPVQAAKYFHLEPGKSEVLREGGSERLLTEENEKQRLSVELSRLNDEYERVRAQRGGGPVEAGARPPGGVATSSTVLPRIDSDWGALSRPLTDATDATTAPESAGPAGVDPSAGDTSEPQTSGPFEIETPRVRIPSGPPARVIVGSDKHGAVGRVLLRSAEEAQTHAQRTRDPEVRKSMEARARQLLENARRELEPLTKLDKPELMDLYHLARCEEKLGNLAAADSLYAEIISRDMYIDADGKEAFGSWGRAAQASKSVLRWVTDTGKWKPTRDVDEIRWDAK